ncbi:MAG: four helix bundle protein [Gemmatimonadaceae bacterium]
MSTTANSTLVTIMRRTSGTVRSLRRALVRRSTRRRSLLSIAGADISDQFAGRFSAAFDYSIASIARLTRFSPGQCFPRVFDSRRNGSMVDQGPRKDNVGIMQDYKRLRVAKRARSVILATDDFTGTLPREEQFGLSSQMRRAAVSIGLNIVESSRSTTREFIRFLEIARGSGMELEFALLVSEDLGMGASSHRASAAELLDHVQRELSALIKAMRKRLPTRA